MTIYSRKLPFFLPLWISFLLILSGCSFILNLFTSSDQKVIGLDQDEFGILFSHNINGETHPCGCRHFPLGGIAQVAGVLHKIKQTQNFIYIDSGDTLFPTSNIPKTSQKSSTYNAHELAKMLSKLGLKYWIPGDQDFAFGLQFIKEIIKETGIELLIANLRNEKEIAHKNFVLFEKGPHKIFIIGLVDPTVLPLQYKKYFQETDKALKETIQLMISQKGYDPKNKFHRLVVATHAGIERDKELARENPSIDWIIGSHTMNFLRFPQDQGKTQIVQVLSRNHYMGHITFNLKEERNKDHYEIHEVRDENKDDLKPNPFLALIDKQKKALSKIQLQEQTNIFNENNKEILPYPMPSNCIECHKKQGDFWQGTPHAIAYQTLIHSHEQNNLSCVKCHSLGLNNSRGFFKVSNIIQFEKSDKEGKILKLTKSEKEKFLTQYWKEVEEAFLPLKGKSIRHLSSKKRKIYAKKLESIDKKHQVSQNFTNVQCLNCHEQDQEHPFEVNRIQITKEQRMIKIQDRCLSCHDPDQSPLWYTKRKNGSTGDVNYQKLKEKIKEMGCPLEEV